MEMIRIVLDEKLLKAADRAALVRDALREHLRRLEIKSLEERDRQGYLRTPQSRDESEVWTSETVWPDE